MKTAKTRLALFVLAAIFQLVKGSDDFTNVANQSSRPIRASTIYYFPGSSGFHNRYIPSGTFQTDQYSGFMCEGSINYPVLQVQAWFDGSPTKSATVNIYCDISVVLVDNKDKSGAEIYQSVFGGSVTSPTGPVLATIYP